MKQIREFAGTFTGAFALTAVAALLVTFAAARTPAEDAASSAGDKPTYVGDKACQKCHFQEHKSWKKTSMAKAMKSLAPTAEADDKALFDKKTAAKLDPAKDYTSDATCLKCHTTGYGTETGYPADPKADEAAGKRAAALGGVGCESCHGPGSLYVKHKTAELEKNKDAKFTLETLAPMGMTKPEAKVCETCHNADNPTKAEFKYEEAKSKTHDHPKK
ncbi:MAG: cytochrome c family protein [Planctomycetes bacterium]|nr:cytochrome c family protein [Planctomycetota bacterium]